MSSKRYDDSKHGTQFIPILATKKKLLNQFANESTALIWPIRF